ncbi:MAG TPA: XTP/dITP diphosphatase [Candidatus Wujingus californicus]|uniref:XTP/dITP diphosphatase n=1 Tax=Candidatus Wujingus californicus TaxID=3367618 RepID=UPI001D4C2036|nr:XTP/dITP diphosphatase [Planctomycetota bacterium]MDO8130397.1 XTP/dITP diphosphatase [Candidatus Brocadiales bacterium]
MIHTKTIVIATQNEKKRKEIQDILKDVHGILLKGVEAFPFLPLMEEDGNTFRENAIKKATILAKACNTWAMADDSGLEINALNGRPGVYSSRYAGLNATDEKNIEKVLFELKGVPKEKRTARFVCTIALAGPHQLFFIVEGYCNGFITEEPKGSGGFGYDSVFYVPDYKQTFAELNPSIKNKISHRAIALEQFKKHIIPLIHSK